MYKPSTVVSNLFPPDMTRPSFPVSDVATGYGLGWINSVYRGILKIWYLKMIVRLQTSPNVMRSFYFIVYERE